MKTKLNKTEQNMIFLQHINTSPIDAVDGFGERRMLKLTRESRVKRIDFEHKIDTYHRLDWINCFKSNF